MLRKAALAFPALVLLAGAARGEEPRVEVSGNVGWTFSDGVSAEPDARSGGTAVGRLDPTDSFSYGFTLGFHLTPRLEFGFLWSRQQSRLEASGSPTLAVGDLDVDDYHGYLAYDFGGSGSTVRPFLLAGAGLTRYGPLAVPRVPARVVSSGSRFSPTFAAGVKVYPGRVAGLKVTVRWTPTHIPSTAPGWWCDSSYGCFLEGHGQVSNQVEISGGLTFRF